MKKWVIDVDTGGGMKQGERERDERRRSNNSRRYASDYQPVSDALETDKEEEWTTAWQEERNIERGRLCVCKPGCKDDRHEKRIIGGSARGEVIEEGQWMFMPKYWVCGVLNPATGPLTSPTWYTVVTQWPDWHAHTHTISVFKTFKLGYCLICIYLYTFLEQYHTCNNIKLNK